MPDLDEKDTSDPVKIVGSDATGVETNYVDAGDQGLHVEPRPPRLTNAVITKFTALTQGMTVANPNTSRVGLLIYVGTSKKKTYIKFGSGASTSDYSFPLERNSIYHCPFRYTGEVSVAFEDSHPGGEIIVTEVTE